MVNQTILTMKIGNHGNEVELNFIFQSPASCRLKTTNMDSSACDVSIVSLFLSCKAGILCKIDVTCI